MKMYVVYCMECAKEQTFDVKDEAYSVVSLHEDRTGHEIDMREEAR